MRSVSSQNAILTGSIPRQLILFFLPIWFGTLFQQLYNTADTLIVGNFVGTQALAAVGATSAFVQLLVGVFCLGEEFTASHAVLFAFVWTGLALFLAGDLLARRRAGYEKSQGESVCV